MGQKARELNIEALRGVLMFMVVMLHVIGINILSNTDPINPSNPNFYIANLIESICVMAVDCYVLISGFFGIRSNIYKYFKFVLPIAFYSLAIYIVYVFCGNGFSIGLFFNAVFPVLSNQYWFVTSYVILFLISPLLNACIDRLSTPQLLKVLLVGVLFFVLVPTFSWFSLTHNRGFGIVNFVLLYFIGAFIRRLNPKNYNCPPLNYLASTQTIQKYIGIFVVAVLIIYVGNIVQGIVFHNLGWKTHMNGYDNLFVYIAAISFFLIFKNLKINWQLVGRLSPSFFYVYIIHENAYVRDWVYKALRCEDYYDSDLWVVHAFGCGILIFCGCLLIDVVRRKTFGKLFDKLSEFLSEISCRAIDAAEYKVLKQTKSA